MLNRIEIAKLMQLRKYNLYVNLNKDGIYKL